MLAAGLNQVLYAGANAMGQPALPSFAELAGMVVTIIGLVALVPRYGYIAAAAISTVAYVTSFLAMLWLSASRLGLHIYEMIFQELDSAIPQLERSA
jgi:O-antigen/teichoic acid export membrane protein